MLTSLTPEHLAWRQQGIGASDAARVMSGDWRSLYAEKMGLAKSRRIMGDWDWALKKAMEILQLDWYEHKTGLRVIRNELLICAEYPFMRASLDGRVEVNGEPLDAKHVSPWSKPTPVEWCVEHYTWQMIHQAIVCGVDRASLSIGVGDKEPTIQPIEVSPYDAVKLIDACREFWGYVERREEPPGDGPSITPEPIEIKKLREIIVPTEQDEVYEALCRQNNWLPDAIHEIRAFIGTEPAAKRYALSREAIKAGMPEDVGVLTWGRFTAKRSKSNAITMTLAKMEDEDGA